MTTQRVESSDASVSEIDLDDVIVLDHAESPAKLREEIWNTQPHRIPEQWHVSAWRNNDWALSVTLFGETGQDSFNASIVTQRTGRGLGRPDVFSVHDRDEDGIVDVRYIQIAAQDGTVTYSDLNMDGLLDEMVIDDSNGCRTYILLSNVWTAVIEAESDDGTQYILMKGDKEKAVEFVDGEWRIQPE